METPPPSGPTPVLLAMLLCESVITDAETQRKTLVGIFDRVIARSLSESLWMAVYARFTDAQGVYKFRLECVDVGRDRPVGWYESHPFEILDRLQQTEIALRLAIPIDAPGLYEFRLYANDAYIGSS
jgi:hypothetical protein